MSRCTCRGGDLPTCRRCEAFEAWNHGLTDAERGQYALDFITLLDHATGRVRGEVRESPMWLGQFATVDFDALEAFESYLAECFDALRVAA